MPARRSSSERPSSLVHCASSSCRPTWPAPDTDWYVDTTMRSMRAARCSGASAVTGIIVVQFGHDAMPFGMLRMSSGLTSATTSGTSGSMRNADDLSMTFAPAAAACGAHSIGDRLVDVDDHEVETVEAAGPQHLAGDLAARERELAALGARRRVRRAARSPGTRAPRGSATSRCRPSRWRPSGRLRTTAYSLSSPNAACNDCTAALHVVFGDHARDPDRRRADHLDVDAFVRERLEHLGGDAGVRLHARADQRHPADVARRCGSRCASVSTTIFSMHVDARSTSERGTVNEMSVWPAVDTFCTIMSTLTPRRRGRGRSWPRRPAGRAPARS